MNITRTFLCMVVLCSAFLTVRPGHACPFEDADHCQLFEDTLHFEMGDRVFDDFVATGDTLTSICFWGFYGEDAVGPCSPAPGNERFTVRIRNNDPMSGRMPGSNFDDQQEVTQRIAIPGTQVEGAFGISMQKYTLILDPPITGLTPGQIYWLSLDYVASSFPFCDWYWSRQAQTSSSYSWYLNPNDGCDVSHPEAFDQAFCLDFEMEASAVGALPGTCCTCDGLCSEITLKECDNAGGAWDETRTSCDGVSCGVLSNDSCADGPIIGEGQFVLPQRCATTDGYGPIETDMGPAQIEDDVWYRFVAPPNCQLTIDTCSTRASCFDSMIAVYQNPDDPFVCPPCALMSDSDGAAISSATLAGMGQNESCTGEVVPDNGRWSDLEQLGRNVLPGECLLIRAGSYGTGVRKANGLLWVDCGDGGDPPSPLAIPGDLNKNRFISFSVPPSQDAPATETALRVTIDQLHVVVPSFWHLITFSLFHGSIMWIGPPVTYPESSTSAETFQVAKVQSTPHYRDWSELGNLHVMGVPILPSSKYTVQSVGISCMGMEGSCTSISRGLLLATSRWGDVTSPFNPPSPTVQPDTADIGALVDKFRNAPGAIVKARALMTGAPGNPWGEITPEILSVDLGFGDISACVDAFRGTPYPYRPGKCAGAPTPPFTGKCVTNSECTGSNGAGPCLLYCP